MWLTECLDYDKNAQKSSLNNSSLAISTWHHDSVWNRAQRNQDMLCGLPVTSPGQYVIAYDQSVQRYLWFKLFKPEMLMKQKHMPNRKCNDSQLNFQKSLSILTLGERSRDGFSVKMSKAHHPAQQICLHKTLDSEWPKTKLGDNFLTYWNCSVLVFTPEPLIGCLNSKSLGGALVHVSLNNFNKEVI